MNNRDKKKGFAYNKDIQPEAKKFVYYAFKYHPFILLNSFLKNTLQFLIRPGEYTMTMHLDKGPIDRG